MKLEKKPRGRPPGNKVLRQLRSQTWLLAVQSRNGGKNNCELDIHFGPSVDGKKRKAEDRLRMFEAVHQNGSIPGNSGYSRNFNLIEKVNSEKCYEGTAAIIHSPFWRLLESEALTLTEIREMVVECVQLLNLAKRPGCYKDDGLDELEELVSSEPTLTIEEYFERQKEVDIGYDLSMGDVLPYSNATLDHIALVGALSLEAIYAGNMKIASYHIDIFKTYLKDYTHQEWLVNKGDDLYEYGVSRMLKALNADALNGLPDYSTMLSSVGCINPNSAISSLLTRHQRMLWRR